MDPEWGLRILAAALFEFLAAAAEAGIVATGFRCLVNHGFLLGSRVMVGVAAGLYGLEKLSPGGLDGRADFKGMGEHVFFGQVIHQSMQWRSMTIWTTT